ncbi:MAG: 16S rRNA (guanine(527)-N(7))-methyltransferase RsmG [Actinomycetota bacterium]
MSESRFASALTRDLPDSVSLTSGQVQQLEGHWALVKQWNARTNLTAVVDDAEAAVRHYADSFVALPLRPLGSLIDIGSGAGYPGFPLAIAAPERQVTLLEPRQKRVSFLEVAAARLGLKNVRVRLGASTDTPDQAYAAAVTRATFSDPADLDACLRWVSPGSPLVAYRTAASGLPGTRVHPYVLGGQSRVLEILTRS